MPLDLIAPKGNVITADFSGIGSQAGSTDWSMSRQWASRPDDQRYVSLAELEAELTERTQRSYETELAIGSLIPTLAREDKSIGFVLEDGTDILRPTNYGFQQITSELQIPQAGFMRQFLSDEPEVVVRCLEKARRQHVEPGKQVKLYTSRGDLRALTSPKYGRLLDLEVVQALREAIAESGMIWEVPTAFAMPGEARNFACVDPTKEQTTLYASDRDVCLFLVDQRNPIQAGFVTDPKTGASVPDLYSRGIIVINGECGGVALKVISFLYRWVCCNRSIREQKGFQSITMRHSSGVREAFLKQLVPAMKEYINGSATGVAEGIERSKNQPLVRSDEEALHMLTHDLRFSPEVAKVIMAKSIEEDQRPIRSTFDMVQAMTAAARGIPFQDQRIQVERQAAKVLQYADVAW